MDDDAAFAEDEAARISALQKAAPEVIWLQIDPDAERFDGWEDTTWCSDRINGVDVKYIRADTIDDGGQLNAEIARLKSELACAWQNNHILERERQRLDGIVRAT